ncbi:MAG: prepilin peptidase [Clostridiales bacterium]
MADYPALLLVLYLFVFLFGSVIGSFLNVVIYRLPRGISFVSGRSFCPACREQLKAWDMIPCVSWLLLRGRCRFCHSPISRRYPAVELFCGLLAVAVLGVYGCTWQAAAFFALLVALVAVALIDWDTMEIPNGLVLYLLFPACALVVLDITVIGFIPTLVLHGCGFMAVAAPLYLLTLLIPDSFGGGDIKLMAVCGLAVGWRLIVVAGFIALIFGGGYGVYLLIGKKADRKSHFAFGPFLVLGIILSCLAGEPLLSWYLSLL